MTPGPGVRRTRPRRLVTGLAVAGLLVAALWAALDLAGDAADAPRRPSASRPALSGAPDGSAPPSPATSDAALAETDWAAVRYPLTCGDTVVRTRDVRLGDLMGDSEPEATVLVSCDAGAGSPPHGLLVYAAGEAPAGEEGRAGSPAPRLVGVLLRPADGVLVSSYRVDGRLARVDGRTYSSPDVARCCPDRRFTAAWRWDGTRFARTD